MDQEAHHGKIAVVTGGTRGIGAAVVRHLAREGWSVLAGYASRSEDAERFRSEAGSADRVAVFRGDVSDPASVDTLFAEAERRFGGLDLVVHCAGAQSPENHPLAATSVAELRRVVDVNLKGALFVMRAAATAVRDDGAIVMISSSTVPMRLPTYGPYSATKAAVENMTAVLAKELGPRGVRVNCVSPGPTATEMFLTGKTEAMLDGIASMSPLGRIARPEDIAEVIAFVAGDRSRWINGQTIAANGGMA